MNRPLRIVLVTTFYPPHSFGGDAIHVRDLARALAAAGHRVDVVHCLDSFDLLRRDSRPRSAGDDPGVFVHGLRSGYGVLSPLLTQQSGRLSLKAGPLRSLLDERRPDVIHYHNVSLFGPEVLALEPHAGQPIKLYTTHEYWLVCPTHLLFRYNRKPCEQPQCLRCTLASGRPPQVWRYTGMIERCARHVDAFLAPSRFAARTHAQFGFTRPMIHFPLFAQRVTPVGAQDPPPHPRPYFLFVGRLERGKNARTLIEAWRSVRDTDLLLAGAGAEEAELRAMAASNPRVRLLGHVDAPALGPLYAHCVACLVPSTFYEVFPLVVLEAFAHGAPVVARDIGAMAEMVGDSGGGVLYRTQTELLAAVARLAADPGLRARLGSAGRTMVAGPWSEDAYLARYFDLLRATARRRLGGVPWEGEFTPDRPDDPAVAKLHPAP